MLELLDVAEAFDHEQADIAEVHRLEVEVFHHERGEVEACHLVEEQVGVDRIAREGEHEILRRVGVAFEIGRLAVAAHGHGVVGEPHLPDHSAVVGQAGVGLAAGLEPLEDAAGHGGHVGFGPLVEKQGELFLEFLGVVFREIREGVDENELRQDLRQRIILLHLRGERMDGGVVVVEISRVGALVDPLLHFVHLAEIVEIGGILHRLPVGGVGEVLYQEGSPFLGLCLVVLAHGHKIHVVVDVEAVDVVGIAFEQAVEFLAGCREILELVFEDESHIVEALLDDLVAGGDFLVGLRNLLEIIFGLVGIVFRLQFAGGLCLLLVGEVGIGGDGVGDFRRRRVVVGLRFVVDRESALVSAAPVVFILAGAPAALELGLSLVFGHGVVEIP